MKFDSKLKGGLAWTGLFVILAVPAANVLLGSPSDSAMTMTSDTSAVTTAPKLQLPAAKPTATPDAIETASVSGDPVDTFVQIGKPLPDYISDAPAAPAAVKAPAVNSGSVPKPAAPVSLPGTTDVASLPREEETPPVPLPRSARPATSSVAVLPSQPSAPAETPLIIDETPRQQASRSPSVEPFPLSDDEGEVIYGDQLEEWDSGSLADYLERRGLINTNRSGSAANDSDYDPDGFFLDEGPNRDNRRRFRDDRDFDFLLF
ncbi:hypothetical protein [Devosia sp.]|uniref:hypothetical protein n=1 Tax=Devosia sp. TaxID=1871048 RepID=UPI003A905F84